MRNPSDEILFLIVVDIDMNFVPFQLFIISYCSKYIIIDSMSPTRWKIVLLHSMKLKFRSLVILKKDTRIMFVDQLSD